MSNPPLRPQNQGLFRGAALLASAGLILHVIVAVDPTRSLVPTVAMVALTAVCAPWVAALLKSPDAQRARMVLATAVVLLLAHAAWLAIGGPAHAPDHDGAPDLSAVTNGTPHALLLAWFALEIAVAGTCAVGIRIARPRYRRVGTQTVRTWPSIDDSPDVSR